ncbi:MAG TPA: hypothetical protein VFX21_04625, partial [Acidimicrobiia bacterium]|nr:hypothetical protein [Acidimicrobiia bacterium]
METSGATGSRRDHAVALGIALGALVLIVGLIAAVGSNDDATSGVVAGAPVATENVADVSDSGGGSDGASNADVTVTTMGAMEHDHGSGASGATTDEHDMEHDSSEHAHTDATTGSHDAQHAHDSTSATSAGEHDHGDAPTTPGATSAGAHE